MKLSKWEIFTIVCIIGFCVSALAFIVLESGSPEDKIIRSDEFQDYLGISDYIISIQTFKDVGGVDVVRYELISGEVVMAAYVMLETRILELQVISSDGVYTRFDTNPVFVYYGGEVSLYPSTVPSRYTFAGEK